MKEQIHLEKLCGENFDSMSTLKNGKFCNTCKTKVTDFTKMSLEEINNFFANYSSKEKVCGRYSARHINQTNFWYDSLNKLEEIFFKTNFRKVALWTITTLLFLTSQYRCFMGMRRVPTPKQKNNNTTAQSINESKLKNINF